MKKFHIISYRVSKWTGQSYMLEGMLKAAQFMFKHMVHGTILLHGYDKMFSHQLIIIFYHSVYGQLWE